MSLFGAWSKTLSAGTPDGYTLLVKGYFDLDGGALFTNKQVPLGTSRANFTTSGALGLHILGERFTWSVDVRFLHISNAGISAANPGINTLQVRIGIGKFTRPRSE